MWRVLSPGEQAGSAGGSSGGAAAESSAGSRCRSTLTTISGRPWAPVRCSGPSYVNSPVYSRAGRLRPVLCSPGPCLGGSEAPITGDMVVAPGGDAQLVVVDTVRAENMNVVDPDGDGTTTVDGAPLTITGAGVSRIFGLVRAPEVVAAVSSPQTAIPHALSVSLPTTMNCARRLRTPATKTDGVATTDRCVPEGSRTSWTRGSSEPWSRRSDGWPGC